MAESTKITFFGHAMFLVESKGGIKIGMDPYNEQVKSNLPDVSSDIVLVSHDHFDHSNTSLFKGNPTIITTPEEKTINDVKIEGIYSFHDQVKGARRGENIMFKFEVDGIKFSHLGDLGHMPDSNQLSFIKDVDILMIPVGGVYTIDEDSASKIINMVKPSVVIPMHYREKDTKVDVNTIDNFIGKVRSFKEMGHTVNIDKEKLPKVTEIWVLKSN